jgi:integration host factor subunit beta
MGLPKERGRKFELRQCPAASLFRRTEAQSRIFGGPAPVIKSELVERVAAQNPHLHARDLEKVVSAILGEIIKALSRGDRVEIRGFGVFSVRNRRARTGRNPRSGASVAVDQKSIPFFKSGKEMRQRLNRSKT